jgi:drug/metabolite transporter (DMT)-like permease
MQSTRSPAGKQSARRGVADQTAGRVRILLAAGLFSTGGAAIKSCGLSAWQVAGFRSGFAALALCLMLPGALGRWSLRTLAVGAAYGSTMLLFVLANKLTTAASAIFLQSTAPLYVLLFGPWLLAEPIRRRELLFMTALGFGLVLFFVGAEPRYASAPDPRQGNVIAALSGVAWALTVVGLRFAARGEALGEEATGRALVAGNIMTLAACLPWSLPIGTSRPVDWLLVAYLGTFQVGLAYVFLAAGLRQVEALDAALLMIVEPVLNSLWAWAIHGESPGPWSLGGAAVILAATAGRAWLDARATP